MKKLILITVMSLGLTSLPALASSHQVAGKNAKAECPSMTSGRLTENPQRDRVLASRFVQDSLGQQPASRSNQRGRSVQ